MKQSSTHGKNMVGPQNAVFQVVEALETQGLDHQEYALSNRINPEALTNLMDAPGSFVEVSFQVKGRDVIIDSNGNVEVDPIELDE